MADGLITMARANVVLQSMRNLTFFVGAAVSRDIPFYGMAVAANSRSYKWITKVPSRMQHHTRVRLIVCALLLPVFCHAEDLPDPTRIPESVFTPVAGAEAQPAGLQSIIISKTRRAAIIDGEIVELGGKHGDARLIKVSEGSVVLESAQGKQVLTLFPGVKMTGENERSEVSSLRPNERSEVSSLRPNERSEVSSLRPNEAKQQSSVNKAQSGKQKIRPASGGEEK